MKKISFVIPCYNSEASIEAVVESIIRELKEVYELHIILADDGSSDNTWKTIKQICSSHENVTALHLAKNFGQQSARMAAVQYADGDYVVFMDDDGQHPPSLVPDMLSRIEEGYDIVYADFDCIKQPWWRIGGSEFRRITAELLEGKPKGVHISAFFAVRSFLICELRKYPSPVPSVFGYLMKSTHNISTIKAEQLPRSHGKSGYTLKKLISIWLHEMIGFSIVPLRLSSLVGFISASIGIVFLIAIIINKLLDPSVSAGYTSTIAVILLFSGLILTMLGIIGEYIGNICMTVNRTPQYVIKEALNVRGSEQT